MSVDRIQVLGVNHKTAPVAVREKLSFSNDLDAPFAALQAIPGCEEFCFLSTCNRVEVIYTSRDSDETARAIRGFLFSRSQVNDQEAVDYTYLHQGDRAINHLFRVAASLDSMVIGEPQILGQLKEAYRESSTRKTTGVILNRLLHKAFSVAKRIRTETNIGSSAVSISFAAVELAKKIFGKLDNKKALLIGAGEMAELAAEHLINQGVSEVVVANRTLERAVKLAQRFKGSAVALSELIQQLETIDILLSSTGAPDLILRKEEVTPVMRKRRNRPLFLIDIAVPRDLDPGLNDLDNVYLYDVDDLSNVVEMNKSEREREAHTAERIVAEDTLKFLQWLDDLEVSPTIADIRRKAEAIRQAELGKTFHHLQPSSKDRKAIDKLTTALVNKLLHDPIMFLKENHNQEIRRQKLDWARKMFSLDINE